MKVQKEQCVILVNPFETHKDTCHQIDHKALNTVLVTNPLDNKTKAECRICQDDETSGSMITPCKCTGSMAHVHKSCLKKWIREKFSSNETPSGPPECEVCGNKFVMRQKRKLSISRCPEITAQDKRRHVTFCVSIFFMLSSLSIVFFAFANMLDRDEKSNNSTDSKIYDILLVVFGVGTFVAFFVAFSSQRHASLSVVQIPQKFFKNSIEWTFTSIDKPCDVTTGEVV